MKDIDITEGRVGDTRDEAQEVYSVVVNGIVIVAATCRSVCVRAARILTSARAASKHDAMRMLINELGMCEDAAEATILLMAGEGTLPPRDRRKLN